MNFHRILAAVLTASLLPFTTAQSVSAQAPPAKTTLVAISQGELPNDTGTDDTQLTVVDDHKELGGKALKVVFASGDSVGMNQAGLKLHNWKPFHALNFEAFSPAQQPVKISLNLFHGGTTNYKTRAVFPLNLRPGKNSVRIGLDEIQNVNGSAPRWDNVIKWFIAADEGTTPTLYFGDIWLEDAAATAAADASGPSRSATAFRVQGKIGGMDVDLIVTPILEAATSAASPVAAPLPAASASGDPKRLARIRGASPPKIDRPIPFDTPDADSILEGLEVFPANNPWNLLVSDWPLHPDSQRIVSTVGAEKPLRYNPDMAFVLVPSDQKRIAVKLGEFASESDRGPYPLPDDIPIEGWPIIFQGQGDTSKPTLDDIQRDKHKQGGDRHAIVVDPVNRMLYEFYQLRKTDAGWSAAGAAIFDLKSNRLRPASWTSTDAAGLPVFPAVVRFDELKRGVIDHALRVTVPQTRRSYVYPATHYASRKTDSSLPRMGERMRLRPDFDSSGFSSKAQTILTALKRYGMFVADNGNAWALSVAPDLRIEDMHEELKKVKGADFQVVQPPAGLHPATDTE